jgi:hypothetical protein
MSCVLADLPGNAVAVNTTYTQTRNGGWSPVTFPWTYTGANAGSGGEISQEFSYTGGPQTFTAPVDGWYQMELWGAQGASSLASTG